MIPTTGQIQIITMAFSPFMAQAVYVVARLGIADLLGAGPRTVEDLAKETGNDAPSLRRLLRALAGATCVSLLRACAAAMPADARVLVIDAVLPPGNDPHPAKLSDLLIMSILPGRERTEEEFREILADAGLKLVRVVPTPSALCIVEAARA